MIVIERLSKRYGAVHAIAELSLTVERGDPVDRTLNALRARYGVQSLSEAHQWLKAQRQASVARLRELDRERNRITGNVPDFERAFHERFVRLFPPRRPGRPRGRKSGR